jgi:hypothetical protein
MDLDRTDPARAPTPRHPETAAAAPANPRDHRCFS